MSRIKGSLEYQCVQKSKHNSLYYRFSEFLAIVNVRTVPARYCVTSPCYLHKVELFRPRTSEVTHALHPFRTWPHCIFLMPYNIPYTETTSTIKLTTAI